MAMDRVDPKAAAARGAIFALAAWRLIIRAVVIILFLLCFLFYGYCWIFWIRISVMSPFSLFFLDAACSLRGVPFWEFYFSVTKVESETERRSWIETRNINQPYILLMLSLAVHDIVH